RVGGHQLQVRLEAAVERGPRQRWRRRRGQPQASRQATVGGRGAVRWHGRLLRADREERGGGGLLQGHIPEPGQVVREHRRVLLALHSDQESAPVDVRRQAQDRLKGIRDCDYGCLSVGIRSMRYYRSTLVVNFVDFAKQTQVIESKYINLVTTVVFCRFITADEMFSGTFGFWGPEDMCFWGPEDMSAEDIANIAPLKHHLADERGQQRKRVHFLA
ncbi:hypothetical protein THAOC_12065, partial [Thalassiosira oceanica]